MRTWRVEHRKRTRHLIELGGLLVKAGVVDLTGDDRAMIFGALLWMADKLQSDRRPVSGQFSSFIIVAASAGLLRLPRQR
ncbi:conjugal transfer protein TraD [Mesorhizobium sp.]|uniref:conjugal transfer protein TraD n=1 Tax=Mesorhizobium sp. TaxID=1871066 RepID=UPI000FE9F23A|nr:conjugal transfer protein TraD [Mesorhizobium sp.]RWE78129.1 MAG: hypothetical protein EOS42_06230 [Mesorhizobium sp.]TIV32551.1 MAG: hypothetical protein E5V90_02605 [Mesorhizobium sp.]